MRLELRYDGELLGSVPITINHQGYYIKAKLSAFGDVAKQVGHIWRNSKLGTCDWGVCEVDSSADHLVEIVLATDSTTELLDGDFVTLEHITVEWLHEEL